MASTNACSRLSLEELLHLSFAWGNCSLTPAAKVLGTFLMQPLPGSLAWFSLGLYSPSVVLGVAVPRLDAVYFFLQCYCSSLQL